MKPLEGWPSEPATTLIAGNNTREPQQSQETVLTHDPQTRQPWTPPTRHQVRILIHDTQGKHVPANESGASHGLS